MLSLVVHCYVWQIIKIKIYKNRWILNFKNESANFNFLCETYEWIYKNDQKIKDLKEKDWSE